jgi:hypothetical protein
MKKRVIRLTEQDVENLVRKIIKEDDFAWAKEIPEYKDEPLTDINDPRIREFKAGDKTTYNGKPVTIVSADPNFIKVKYDETGGIFELTVNPGIWKSDPEYYKSLHSKDIRNVKDLQENLDWIGDVPSLTDMLPSDYYMREIHDFQDMLDCCSQTRWDVAYQGTGIFDRYYQEYGPFEVYFDSNDTPLMACTGKNKDECFSADDSKISKYRINEASWDFDWDSVLGNQGGNKWHTLERELSDCIEPLVEKYKTDFGNDSYAVIDAIYQILDGMFQKR